MATTTPQQNRYKNTLFDITELLYLIFCFTAYTATGYSLCLLRSVKHLARFQSAGTLGLSINQPSQHAGFCLDAPAASFYFLT
jgi:hypothetical protein